MDFPEVWRIRTKQNAVRFGSTQLNGSNIQRLTDMLPTSKMVSILLPEHKTDEIIEAFHESDYYTADNFKIANVLSQNFISAYANDGRLSITSVSQPSLEPCEGFSINNGKLLLNLHKSTLSSLSATSLAQYKLRCNDDITSFEINLLEESDKFQKLQDELKNDVVPNFTINFFWTPKSNDICPSSIAKYIAELNCNVKLQKNAHVERLEYSLRFPQIDPDDDHRWQDITEYIGMVVLGCNMDDNTFSSYQLPENCTDVGGGRVLHWKGFITQDTVKNVILELRKILLANEEFPWVALSIIQNSSAKWKMFIISRDNIFFSY